jgi:hypothetical protein
MPSAAGGAPFVENWTLDNFRTSQIDLVLDKLREFGN